MEIKYWSDIACPFCYIGSNRMKRAMKEIGIYDTTELEFKSFELNPATPKETDEGYINHFTQGNKAMEPQAKSKWLTSNKWRITMVYQWILTV